MMKWTNYSYCVNQWISSVLHRWRIFNDKVSNGSIEAYHTRSDETSTIKDTHIVLTTNVMNWHTGWLEYYHNVHGKSRSFRCDSVITCAIIQWQPSQRQLQLTKKIRQDQDGLRRYFPKVTQHDKVCCKVEYTPEELREKMKALGERLGFYAT